MSQPASPKVYYHHLKKTGGTSLNLWLDSQFPAYRKDHREVQLRAYGSHPDEPNQYLRQRLRQKAYAEGIFTERDLHHDHAELAGLVPQGTFCFTVLRRPVDRLLSQVRDNRRLLEETVLGIQGPLRSLLIAVREQSLREALSQFDVQNNPQFYLFDNYMTRSLATTTLGDLARVTPDASALLPVAMEALENHFDLVGLLEEDALTRRLLAARLGWMPPAEVPVQNRTDRNSTPSEEVADAHDVINQLTCVDERLYSHAKKLFESAKQKLGTYDLAEFEQEHVRHRMSQLRAVTHGAMSLLQMDQPITASGHSGRYTNPAGHSWVWTSNTAPFVLYMPVPAQQNLTLSVRFVDTEKLSLDQDMSTFVRGREVPHRIRQGQGTTQWIDIDHDTDEHDYVRVELRFGGRTTGEHDFARGLLVDQYGWRIRDLT